MAKTLYNHKRRILNLQPAILNSLYSGVIVQFKYSGENIYDPSPLVLVLWNDYLKYKIHGVNLNYLSEYKVKRLFDEITKVEYKGKPNILKTEDQDDSTYDDHLPYRNLLKDPYTRVKLPTYAEKRNGIPTTKTEAVKQMGILYEKHLKKIVKKEDMYRSYSKKKMSTIRVVEYDTEGLLK